MSYLSSLIEILHNFSDAYGYPYSVGFLDKYGLDGFIYATEEQLLKYILEEGLPLPSSNISGNPEGLPDSFVSLASTTRRVYN